ncbi:hypothetical protein K435DRAFT_934681 [Dendrothele bispora CBS 962.96]|uniref:Uncharacterized protein n=1 Tax=Dendrothele bispora (strain CBS 962.96) TaxID=1314807 RepID=A0A4V6T5J4_DENBC|nr:hypothetical protein K435DRAFT_934681 [Dendrothele bispora CBS 962.96]
MTLPLQYWLELSGEYLLGFISFFFSLLWDYFWCQLTLGRARADKSWELKIPHNFWGLYSSEYIICAHVVSLRIQKYNAAPPARSPSPIYESPERLRVIRNDSNDSSNSSNSPLASPLGNVDDLDNYRDLFYRPILPRNDSNASTTARVPWDVNPNGRIGSGLTSIARQLSEELEDIRGGAPSLHHSISLSSRSSLSALRQSAYSSGRSPPAESGLHFVFSNIPDTASKAEITSLRKVTGDGSIMAFKPSIQIPEDIASSRASSPTRSPLDNDELGKLDLAAFLRRHVHSLATPPAMTTENRVSYTGQVAFADGEDAAIQQIQNEIPPHSPLTGRQTATSHSSLQPLPLSSDPTRSSYLTSSDASRMSHLSDFPAPPPQQLTPAHMSLLSSYFDETLSPSELTEVKTTGQLKPGARSRSGSVQTSRPNLEPRNTPRLEPRAPTDIQSVDAQSRRLTFGGDEEIEDLLASLSSHS